MEVKHIASVLGLNCCPSLLLARAAKPGALRDGGHRAVQLRHLVQREDLHLRGGDRGVGRGGGDRPGEVGATSGGGEAALDDMKRQA